MASGHWEYKQVWHQVSAAGSGYWVTQKVWVADPVKPQPGNVQTAQNAAQAAALAAAKKKAAALAAAKRKELLRKQMWERLKNRSKDIRDNIAPPKNTPNRAPLDPNDPRYENKLAAQRRGEINTAAAAAQKKAQDAANARWDAMAKFYERKAREARDAAAIEAAKKDLGSKATGKTLERLLREARERQKASGGQDLDVKTVAQLSELYDKHAAEVSKRFGDKVTKLNKLLVKKKGKYYYRDEAASLEAAKILRSKEYKQALREYDRLYGDGDKVLGEYTTTQNVYGEIAQQQRTYIRDAAKETFFKGYEQLKSGDKDDRAEAAQMLKNWESGGKYMFEATIAEIDPGKTSVKQWVRSRDGGLDPVYRTVEEEFEYRQQQYMAEMKRQNDEYNKQRALELQRQQRNRHMLREDAAYGQARNRNVELLAKTSQALGLDPKKGPTTREEMNTLVDEAMKSWSAENRKWFYRSDRPALSVYEQMAWQGKDPRTFTEDAAFKKAYEAKRAELYAVFSSEAPGILETAVNLPVIKPALQVLGGIGSLPLVLGRLEAAAGGKLLSAPFGEKFEDVGNNTSKLGGVDPTIEEAPAHIQKLMNDAAAKAESDIKDQGTAAQMAYGQSGGNWAAGVARRKVYEDWLKTPEGQKWYNEKLTEKKKASSAEDTEFYKGIYEANGDIWKTLDALSTYGGNATGSPALNLVLSLATDPTNAIPLKATTWLARMDHAMNATKNVQGLLGVRRASEVAKKWLTVNEPTLRAEKTFKPYFEALDKGADPAQVTEQILAKIAGDMSVAKDAAGARKVLEKFGIDPRSASGHQLMTLVEERLLETFQKAGVDYRDIAKQAAELEKGRAAKEAADKAARSENIRKYDAKTAAAEATARTAAESGYAREMQRKADEISAVRERLGRPVPEVRVETPPSRRMTVSDVAPDVMRSRVDDILSRPARGVTRRDVTPPSALGGSIHTLMRNADPLRRAASDDLNFARPRDAQKAANTVQAIAGSTDVVTAHGEQWASAQAAAEFASSAKGRRWLADLEATLPNGKPNLVVRKQAQASIYEAARRSIAKKIAREESLLTRAGDTTVPLRGGRIQWEYKGYTALNQTGGDAYMVVGGRPSHMQYIATGADLAIRGGAKNPTEELVVAAERQVFEETKQRLLMLRSRLETGKLTQEMFDEEVKQIQSLGVVRRHADLSTDIGAGVGITTHGVLDEILDGIARDFIPTGNILVEDLMAAGHLNLYYETLSMLPAMMKGPGYETPLMRQILDPAWRASLLQSGLTKILRANKGMFMADEVGPVAFREGATHLFALFHLTLLDGNVKALERFGRSIETLLYNDPENIFGRMWKVMETRADVAWSQKYADEVLDDFAVAEEAFTRAAMLGGRLHPNLALAMIPYGPLARNLPISHGLTGHLRGLATTLNDLVKWSPMNWTDDAVTQSLTKMSKRSVTTREAVTLATQIIHYAQSRYGNALRRANFAKVMQDFAIEASERIGRDTYAFQELRSRYIRMREEGMRTRLPSEEQGMFFETPDEIRIGQLNNEAAAVEFDNMFNRAERLQPTVKGGNAKTRLDFPALRGLYDDMYWAGEITHDLPGIHTTQFLMKMGDPAMTRGDTWVKYANAYWDHMVGAGAEAEAREILKIMFEPEVARAAGIAYEQQTNMGKNIARQAGETRGAVIDFFDKTGLMPSMDRIIAEGKQRVRREKTYAESEVANTAMRNEFFLQDEEIHALADEAKSVDQITSMYDNADISNIVAETKRQYDIITQMRWVEEDLANGKTALRVAEDRLARIERDLVSARRVHKFDADRQLFAKDEAIKKLLGEKAEIEAKIAGLRADPDAAGKIEVPRIARPGQKRMDAARRGFYSARKRLGDQGALDWLRGRPDDERLWLNMELRAKAADRELTMLMNSVMRKMIHMEDIPISVGDDIETMIKQIADMPGGQAWINGWAERYAQDLYASRLIDYLRHEQWFNDTARAASVASAPTELRTLYAEMKSVKDRLASSDLTRDERVALTKRKQELGQEISRKAAPKPEAKPSETPAEETADEAVDSIPEAPAAPEAPIDTPPPPTPADLNHGKIRMSQRVLEMLTTMTEEQWLHRELLKAQRARRMHVRGTAEYNAITERIRDIDKAFKVIEVAKSNGKGSFIPPKARRTFTSTILSVAGDRAKAVFAPKLIAPYVGNGAAAIVEQGRTLNRLLRNSPVDEALGSVRKVGEVSETYAKHGAAIEASLGQPISSTFLRRHGFPDDLMEDITGTQLITNLDEFGDSLRNPRFNEFVTELSYRASQRLRAITGDPTYSIERWLDDRLVQRSDFYDARKFETDDLIVADAISKARNGARRRRKTDLRQRPGKRGENPLVEMIETDIRAVIGKSEALARLGVDPHAYNEARKVLRPAMLKKRYAHQIVAAATKKATDDLYAAGHRVDDADWDKLFREAYDEAFMAKRKEMAETEAMKMLEQLAGDEMFGSSADDIITEFERRYGTDMDVKGFEPAAITPYQRRTLEEAVKTHLGVTDVNDPAQMVEALSRHGQHPPFTNRSAMREWLAKYGFWSPRTAQAVEAGKKSWSIQDEAKYYIDNWGFTPDWANPALIEEGGALREILFDERLYGEQNRLWGLFNRNMEARFATGKMTREERARLMVEGSESLGIKAKRDLPMERKYVIERYGRLVTDEAGNLTAFPWLMNREELRAFFVNRTGKGAIPDNLIQNAEELRVVEELIEKHIGKYFDETVMAGKPATYADLHGIAANIVTDLLENPAWLKRKRDWVGRLLRGQAEFRRSLVFTQLGFLTTNVIDSGIKGAWTAFITRSFRNGPVSAKAAAMTLEDFGLNPLMTQLFTEPVARGTKRFAKAAEEGKVLRQIQGLTEIPAQGAAAAENFTKLRLAQSMYDGVYAMALKKLKDPKLADAAAREFIGKEVSRLWPTVGDGPIEQLFNNISPFMSYQFKNRVLFISEMASHPAMYNYFNYIGNYIEKENRARWEREGTIPDPKNARLIELPWAPGHFIDFGTFSDAQRGLKPLYDAADGKVVVGNFLSQFVRLAGPNDINFALGILNALKLPMRTEYVQRMDEDGFPTGVWDEVEVPWEAPWGGEADMWNSFWPVEWDSAFGEAMKGKFSVTELTKLAYRTLFFGTLKQTDKGAALNAVYYALKEKDPKAAEAWLTTADGRALQMWWLDKAKESKEWYAPQDFKDILNPPTADPNPWFHAKSKEFQEKVKADLDQLNMIRRKWDNVIFGLSPGTDDYRQARLRAANERYQFFQDHPELYEFFAFSMTPEEWSQQLDDWAVDDLVDTYYNMKAPKAEDYKTAVLWQKAVKEWKAQREAYLKMFPKVAERIGQARDSVEQVWHDTEQGWFDILDKVGTKSIALEAARQSEDYDLLDQLYIANDLDYKMLNEDVAVHYFNTVTDFVPLERDIQGPLQMRKDPFGHALLPLTKVLPDFNKWRYDRMTVDQKAEYERNMKYGKGMKEIIDAAKKSDNFGATFVRELKKKENKWLLEEYFRRNKGKREKWAENDEYIRLISKYGLLAKAGKFTEAGRYFDSLPPWVKSRYYEKHPDRRAKAQENMQYMNYMERWTNFYRRRDYAGGAAFFDRLPKWVQDRYYSKHPENQGGFSGGSSPYSRAMGKWVKLLQDGKKDEAKAYFDSLPKAYKDRYYAKHPEQKIKNNIKRVGQLGEYFAADDANRALYLKNNPNFAKWLRAQGNSESTRRMLVLAAYQGLPKDDQWLRRVFREKYPEIFSQEAKGEQSLKKTYNFLAEHPDMLPGFEKWVEAVWESYAENMKHTAPRPKPIESDHSRQRQHGTDRYPGRHTAKSAAWVRLHSI